MDVRLAADWTGLTVAVVVLAVAVVLGVWQWSAQSRRGEPTAIEDQTHFRRQDARRWLVCWLMAMAALGIAIGSSVDPRRGAGARQTFALVWLAVGVDAIAMLVLAMFDWVSTLRYAHRHRIAIEGERRAFLAASRARLAREFDLNAPEKDNEIN